MAFKKTSVPTAFQTSISGLYTIHTPQRLPSVQRHRGLRARETLTPAASRASAAACSDLRAATRRAILASASACTACRRMACVSALKLLTVGELTMLLSDPGPSHAAAVDRAVGVPRDPHESEDNGLGAARATGGARGYLAAVIGDRKDPCRWVVTGVTGTAEA